MGTAWAGDTPAQAVPFRELADAGRPARVREHPGRRGRSRQPADNSKKRAVPIHYLPPVALKGR